MTLSESRANKRNYEVNVSNKGRSPTEQHSQLFQQSGTTAAPFFILTAIESADHTPAKPRGTFTAQIRGSPYASKTPRLHTPRLEEGKFAAPWVSSSAYLLLCIPTRAGTVRHLLEAFSSCLIFLQRLRYCRKGLRHKMWPCACVVPLRRGVCSRAGGCDYEDETLNAGREKPVTLCVAFTDG
jgi:hypothetical protein